MAAVSRSEQYPIHQVAANLRTQGPMGGIAADRIDEVGNANDRMSDLENFLSGTDIAFPPKSATVTLPTKAATVTKTDGKLTITIAYKPVNEGVAFTVTLAGSVSGAPPLLKDFVVYDGVLSKDKLDGKAGLHQTFNNYVLDGSNKPVKVIVADNWLFPDKTGQGGQQILPVGAFVGYNFDSTNTWDWLDYQGSDPATGTKLAHVKVNPDNTGLADIFCKIDNQKRINATWKSTLTGQVCGFFTKCDDQDKCDPFPKK